MAYHNFTLSKVVKSFNLSVNDRQTLFSAIKEIEPSAMLKSFLKQGIPLANSIASEKAKSEYIIAPLLLELKILFAGSISIFSGVSFDVDLEQELNGVCDFIITKSPQQFFISAPVAVIVEAKDDKINAGLG